MNLPPLNSLRAFSAVAETRSYTFAADRLNVTQAAVSQQVKILEKRLGIALVTRIGRGIELTGPGALLARELDLGFEIIGRGVERLSEDAANRPVQVTMSPAFAVEWLMPRIAEFQRENPEITLMLNPTSDVVELKSGGIDVAIRYRDRRRPGPDIEPVLISDMIVIGAPSLIGNRDLSDPASLSDLPWLQELGTNEAAEWFTFHGVVPDRPLTVNHMPGNLIMSAVRRGDGITYTARAFFKDDLEAGKVVELFSETLFGVYYIQTPQEYERPATRTFLDWLKSKAETVSA
ncbi:LysR family transcriptional regulator [Pseudohalocynthiibacter aestuariivivens]|uniref:LysR family transcriptional regulator n=1 Tax=Pseudohalocynthiibacter aestuariivivens TaxID=1591409 RepID=A0ABV5JDG2_9RHOB|nr:LysR family transcriptional regulator [Pseudohalocynthiibacter aestuariivivens]MBS9718533.1 LysR family transcriptional regulator [Pseudohalocynthiibacter aestuariivivens]